MAGGRAKPSNAPANKPETAQQSPAEKRDEIIDKSKKAREGFKKQLEGTYMGVMTNQFQKHMERLAASLKKLYGIDFYALITKNRNQREIADALKGKMATITPENAKKLAIDMNRLPSLNKKEGTGEWMFRCLNKGETDTKKQLVGIDEVLVKPQKKDDAYFVAALQGKFLLAKEHIFHKEGELSIKESATPKNGKSDFFTGDVVFSKERQVSGFIVGRDANGLFINTGKETKKYLPFKDCVYVFHLHGNSGTIPLLGQTQAGSAGNPSQSPPRAGLQPGERGESARKAPTGSTERGPEGPHVTTSFKDGKRNKAELGVIGDSLAVGLRQATKSHMKKSGTERPITGYQQGSLRSREILRRMLSDKKLPRTDAEWESATLSPEYQRQFANTDRLAVLAGTNGIEENVANNFRATRKIIELYLKANPNGICYVFTLYPQKNHWRLYTKDPKRLAKIARHVAEYNNMLREYANSNPRVRALDLFGMLGGGSESTPKKYSTDGVHLNWSTNYKIARAFCEGGDVNL